ncbi:MAG: hypothetical protein JJT94_14415 [Bernardetiaceae bacterium]|nr:hypothetical protein [Bernardetiaceae bacterium]
MTRVYSAIMATAILFMGLSASLGPKNIKGDDLVSMIIKSIPSSIEISSLIKETGAGYNKSDLNDPAAVEKYATSYDRALNLGVYGTDLGYASIYNKNQDVLDYLTAVKKMADGLSIGQFFDAATLKDLASKSGDLEELINTSTKNLEDINNQLQTENREHLSVLFVTGGWIESAYLTSQIYNSTNNPKLKERLAEQKVILDQLLIALNAHKMQPKFSDLIADLKELEKVYRGVKVSTVGGNGKSEVVNGELTASGGGTTTYEMSDADAKMATALIKNIRNKIVK